MSQYDAVKIGIVSISDRASTGFYADKGLPALQDWLTRALHNPITFDARLIADEQATISQTLIELVDAGCSLVLTTGGTGPALRDVTPEATQDVCERNVPGIAEAMRAHSLAITPFAMLSRALCMQRGRHIVINLPGSEKAARENWDGIVAALPHAAKMMAGGGH